MGQRPPDLDVQGRPVTAGRPPDLGPDGQPVHASAPASPPTGREALIAKLREPIIDRASPVGRAGDAFRESLNPVTIVGGLARAVTSPIETGRALANAHIDEYGKAKDLRQQGRYLEAAGHGLASVLPVVGPTAANIGEQIASGQVAEGVGRGAGLIAPFIVKPGTAPARQPTPVSAPKALTPAEEAVRFARTRDIPMSAGQVTGNPVIRGVEQINERTSPLAAAASGRARAAQATALERVGNEIADAISPSSITPEQAGQGVRDAVRGAVNTASGDANAAYGELRRLEAASPIAVSVDSAKKALAPIYERLKREAELVPLQGGKAKALTALDRLMTGPNTASLSDVDSALGDLKSLARADIPELRTQGQGIAAGAVKFLDAQVRGAAAQAGPDVLQALEAGRKATIAKYAARDLLDTIREEPVQAFRQTTYAKDAGVDHLRELAKIAPAELPKIGRAYIEDLLTTATSEGGFGKTGTLAAKWDALGPQTKAMLYSPAHVQDLDNFFRFAKSAGQNVNPSGSGFTAALTASGVYKVLHPATGIPLEIGQGALAKLLWSPTTTRLLTQGLKVPARSVTGLRVAGEIVEALGPTATATGANIPTSQPQPLPSH